MKTKYIIVALLAIMTGCATYYPQIVDVPLIKEKGDLRINAGASWAPSVHATVSYGMTDVVAVQMYGSLDFGGRGHVQGALGLFKGFENNAVIELYGGYGYGNSLNWDEELPQMTSRDYHLPFIQFNIGKSDRSSVHVDYGLGLKVGYLNTYLLSRDDYRPSYSYNDLIAEPCIFFRFGKKVKYSVMFKYLWTRDNITNSKYYSFNNINVGMGVNISL